MINLDKMEYVAIPPMKFWEYMANENSKVLFWLCAKEDMVGYKTLGRWAGDRVIVIGDYDPDFETYIEGARDITEEVVREVLDYASKNDLPDMANFMKETLEIIESVRD